MKLRRIVIFVVAGALISCLSRTDPYSSEISRLADESIKEKQAFVAFEKRIGNIPIDSKGETYLTADDALKALDLFKNYPSQSDAVLKIHEMIRSGIPAGANQRIILKARTRAFNMKIHYVLQLTRRLMNSAKKFNWQLKKRKELGQLILLSARHHVEMPDFFIQTMIDLVVVKMALENGFLKSSPDTLKRLEELQRHARNESKKLNESFARNLYLPEVLVDHFDDVENFAPTFIIKKWNEAERTELLIGAQIESELNVILLKIHL